MISASKSCFDTFRIIFSTSIRHCETKTGEPEHQFGKMLVGFYSFQEISASHSTFCSKNQKQQLQSININQTEKMLLSRSYLHEGRN